jgi:tetratricopeptide (TPR) repeat protein
MVAIEIIHFLAAFIGFVISGGLIFADKMRDSATARRAAGIIAIISFGFLVKTVAELHMSSVGASAPGSDPLGTASAAPVTPKSDISVGNGSYASFISSAEIALSQGDSDAAIDRANMALSLKKDDSVALDLRGRAAQQKGNDDDALSDFEAAVKADGKNTQAGTHRDLIYDRRSDATLASLWVNIRSNMGQ